MRQNFAVCTTAGGENKSMSVSPVENREKVFTCTMERTFHSVFSATGYHGPQLKILVKLRPIKPSLLFEILGYR